jgi:TPR repeat protein
MRLLLALLSGLGLAALIVFVAERVMPPAVAAPAEVAARPPAIPAEPLSAQALWARAAQGAWPALTAKAEAGDVDAQFQRGMAHLTGAFGPADAAEGRRWLTRAAEQGHGRALNALGEVLVTGELAEPDHPKAIAFFQAAWKAGEPMGLVNLGILAEAGEGRPKDPAEALRCFRQAADRGCAAALLRLGVIRMEGDLLPKDEVRAVRDFRDAAERGSAQAWMNLALAYQRGQGAPLDKPAALACGRKAWELGVAEAAYLVADRLIGDGGDPVEAAGYLLAVRLLDGSPECREQCERRKGPWMDKIQGDDAWRQVLEVQERLLAAECRRRLREIFGP